MVYGIHRCSVRQQKDFRAATWNTRRIYFTHPTNSAQWSQGRRQYSDYGLAFDVLRFFWCVWGWLNGLVAFLDFFFSAMPCGFDGLEYTGLPDADARPSESPVSTANAAVEKR